MGDGPEELETIGNSRHIEAVWYTERMMGETDAQTICENRLEYKPGHWFNSAKFFDIEYQTYGWVFANKKKYEEHFHWKHDDDTKCITVAFHKESQLFLGINTFGLRMKHEVFDRWLSEKRDINYVMGNLSEANFDPEFYKRFEGQVLRAFTNKISLEYKKQQ